MYREVGLPINGMGLEEAIVAGKALNANICKAEANTCQMSGQSLSQRDSNLPTKYS